jgi:hypothetical protein
VDSAVRLYLRATPMLRIAVSGTIGFMADSAALRNRRKRAHARGDHALCRQCTEMPAPAPVAGRGAVERAVSEFVSRRPFAEGDPRGITSVVAVRLAQVVDTEGSVMAARELRTVVGYLADWSDLPGDGDYIDSLNAQGHARALNKVMDELALALEPS